MVPKPISLNAWIWFYRENRRNYGGTHFTAKKEACTELLSRMEGWDKPLQHEWEKPRRPKIVVEMPELDPLEERKISGGLSFRCFRHLHLLRREFPGPIQVIQYREERLVEINFDREGQKKLEYIIREVLAERGDTSIAVDFKRSIDEKFTECYLNYWPCFGHLWVIK